MDRMGIVLAGAGGFALEVEQYIIDCAAAGRGLFDSDGSPVTAGDLVALDSKGADRSADFRTTSLTILDTDSGPRSDVHFLIAIGQPDLRRSVWLRLRERGARFATLVHPTAYVAGSSRVGRGCIVCPFGFVGVLADVGPNVALNVHCSIGHDAVVGDHSVLSPFACVGGESVLGAACLLGPACVVAPKKTIGAYSRISAGAAVYDDFGAGHLLVGNPARGRRMFAVPDGGA
jgi:sugar O-acyltransferase (sialic acid O-acetyltransferase NeuD family)